MSSVDWHYVADNWFGGYCCSFGGISEKLVAREYTLENLFTNQLLENAKDELSFGTVVRDLNTQTHGAVAVLVWHREYGIIVKDSSIPCYQGAVF
ncbi:hypothetical protein HS088_TW14G00134 [Tripterygium wilfordii]|uniref:Uncharacterized protein n=1 Tax=Tripterygium wilfordii TaxID=458696 RepID=A0A7J7CPI2_TRIWF|nr:hypothetical protein HS088_TW14G00134 [Tripterygium wilfordii]